MWQLRMLLGVMLRCAKTVEQKYRHLGRRNKAAVQYIATEVSSQAQLSIWRRHEAGSFHTPTSMMLPRRSILKGLEIPASLTDSIRQP